MKIKAVLFDFIGTTVKEKHSFVATRCLREAFIEHGVFLKPDFFNSAGDRDTITIISEVLNRYGLSLSIGRGIYGSYTNKIRQNPENFCAVDDSLFVISYLLRIGVLIGIGTSLSREVFDIVLSHLGWSKRGINYIGFSGEIGESRPAPNMVFDMMAKLGIKEPQEVLKVADTIAGIREGKNAGCLTAVILSGSQAPGELIRERPDYILRSLSDLKTAINENANANNHSVRYRLT